MNEAEVRARYGQEVGAPNKELLWEWLKRHRYVAEVCNGDIGWEEFKEVADEEAAWHWQLLGRSKPPGRSPRGLNLYPGEDAEITAVELDHAAALAPYLAKRAALLPEVRGFREEKLGGGTLDHTQVADFLCGEFAHLPSEIREALEWALEQIPSDIDSDGAEELEDLVGGWTNRSLRSISRHWSEEFRRISKYESTTMGYTPSGPFMRGLMHLIRDGTGNSLEDLGRYLASLYPWPLRDASWFVITGEAPEVEALNIKSNPANGTCSITLTPWISEETLRRAYRGLHERDNRPLGRKVLSAFRFVDENTEPDRTPKWAELTRRWNQRCKKRNREDFIFYDGSALKRAYERVEKRLASPWANEQGQTAHSDL